MTQTVRINHILRYLYTKKKLQNFLFSEFQFSEIPIDTIYTFKSPI